MALGMPPAAESDRIVGSVAKTGREDWRKLPVPGRLPATTPDATSGASSDCKVHTWRQLEGLLSLSLF